jgi:hypothetical protein
VYYLSVPLILFGVEKNVLVTGHCTVELIISDYTRTPPSRILLEISMQMPNFSHPIIREGFLNMNRLLTKKVLRFPIAHSIAAVTILLPSVLALF